MTQPDVPTAAPPPGPSGAASMGAAATEAAPAGLTPEAFGALLCSRICHDLISPVGAIGNGVELLRELDAAEGAELELIGRSAEMASAQLQFLRLAFGAAPPEDPMGWSMAQRVARAWFDHQKPDLDWPTASGETTRAAARLVCNLLQVAVSCLPRGGRLRVDLLSGAEGTEARIALTAEGAAVRPPQGAAAWLAGEAAEAAPGPREVHFAAAALNARALGARIGFEAQESRLALSAVLPAAA